jgi:outer membrane protein TolC
MKQLAICLFAVWLSPVSAAPLGSDLAGLLSYAREHNPQLAATRYEAEAAARRIQPAGALPDPVLRTELMDITNQGTNKSASILPSGVGNTRYLLMQAVPWYGRRDLQREVARAQALQADGQTAATWAELSGKIKAAYAMYYFQSGSEKLAHETLAQMTQLEQIAHTRYANGIATQQEVIRAQIEKSGLQSDLVELENEKHHTYGRLNALLSRPATAELAEPQAPRIVAEHLDYAALEAALRARNPQLQIAEAASSEAQKSRDLIYSNRYPGFTLGVAPNQSGSTVRSWDLMVELNIPLQQESRRSQEHEAEAKLAASSARAQALQDQMLNELSESVAGFEAAKRTEALVDTRMLPQAELSFQSAMAGYQNGKIDLSTLLEAHRQVLKARQQRIKAGFDAQLRMADIERLTGE